jgi:hypothetical protein
VPLGKIQGRSFGVDELVAGVRAILHDRKEATK